MSSLFVDHLTVIDFSYLDPERGIVGESWIVDLQLDGTLNEQGMVFDFGPVKKQIKAAVDAGLDHRFVVPKQMPGLQLTQNGDQVQLYWAKPELGMVLDYRAPAQAFFWLESDRLTPDAARTSILNQLETVVPHNVDAIHINLHTEHHNEAYYHYSHGLKKHDGDCQRMIHGHRSRIQVFQDHQRAHATERELVKQWQDIYLVTREDIVGTQTLEGIECFVMRYKSQQGQFEMVWPVARCDILETDSTVELIAQHLVTRLHSKDPDSHWRVKAYEGVHKGAYAATDTNKEPA